ncbi:TPA: hypothetical protein ACH3X2_004888 [Trebouxia sp. C0005]|nr:MAG: hypothetical protein FRX49_00106 [Trebouxia sp. A1-2]
MEAKEKADADSSVARARLDAITAAHEKLTNDPATKLTDQDKLDYQAACVDVEMRVMWGEKMQTEVTDASKDLETATER